MSVGGLGLPGGSDGNESACNAGNLGSIPGLGRSPGEGTGYPLQYSCLENPRDGGAWWAALYGVAQLNPIGASLVAQIVKNLPAMQKTRVCSLVWEDPLEKGMATPL